MKKLTLILAIVMVLSMIATLPTSAAKISSTEIKKSMRLDAKRTERTV